MEQENGFLSYACTCVCIHVVVFTTNPQAEPVESSQMEFGHRTESSAAAFCPTSMLGESNITSKIFIFVILVSAQLLLGCGFGPQHVTN